MLLERVPNKADEQDQVEKLDGCMDGHPEEWSVHSSPEVAEDPVLLGVIAPPFHQLISGDKEDVCIPEEVQEDDDWIGKEEQ